jgi:dimethylglycine dehydrogenase
MDISTLLGYTLGLGLIVWSMSHGGGIAGLALFVHPPAAAVVVGGSLAAIMIHFPLSDVKNMIKVILKNFLHRVPTPTEEIERISPELMIGFERFPTLKEAGIRRWVNGAFTFTPDGNPLVGPVPGLRNFWVACGCMGGFSQGGAIGRVLASWMMEADPGTDVFGMDVARYGAFASNEKYLREMTAQFYSRRFIIAYPNEELWAGRPVKTTPVHECQARAGARFGVVYGTETPQYFTPDEPQFRETPSLRRSNADRFVADEVAATRSAAGLLDTSVYARYEVSGPGAEKWLDHLLASRLPPVGRVRLAPMLNKSGHLMGDLSVTRLGPERFWIVGSYYLQQWHLRWFNDHRPSSGVHIQNLSESWLGFSLSGPNARGILAAVTFEDVSNTAFPFMACRELDVGSTRAVVARLSLTGELGYELYVPALQLRALWDALVSAGMDQGMKHIGMRAQDSMRLEKGYGVWSLEFSTSCTPASCGLDRFVAPDQGGPRDLVTPMQTGLLLGVAEFEAQLPASVGHLLAERRRYAVAARRSVLHRTWPAICEELLGHYRAVARTPMRGPGPSPQALTSSG